MVTSYLFMEQTQYEKEASIGCGQCWEACIIYLPTVLGRNFIKIITASELYF